MLNMGIALCQSVSERERAASRCHWLMSVFDACPNVCVCVCAPESVWSCDTASMASTLHLRLQLQLLDPLYVIRSWWRMLARRSECAKEKCWPSSQDAEGSSDTVTPPTKKGCMTTVCAYVLQKQACEMSHDCDMSLVQCLLPIFWFTSESAWTSARISETKKNSCQLLRPCYSVMLKADQHFLLLSPPQNVSTNGKERLPWPHCLLWIWISVLILSDCGDVYRNNQAISYTYERRVFTTVGLTFHQIVSNKIQQCKHGGGSCTSWEAC